jgi:hypothetical protein
MFTDDFRLTPGGFIPVKEKAKKRNKGRQAVRVLISLPEEFLEEVTQRAKQEYRSRSELVREALRAYMSKKEVTA